MTTLARLDVSGHLTAGELLVGGATVLVAIFALVQIAVERRSRQRQEHRAQAVRVSAWPHSYWGNTTQTVLVLNNGSDGPVYRAIVSFVFIQGAAPHTGKELVANWDQFGPFVRAFAVIPPGRHYTTVPSGWAGMMRRPGVEIAFVDQAGANWVRTADGQLSEIRREPVDHYGLSRPVSWDIPLDRFPQVEVDHDVPPAVVGSAKGQSTVRGRLRGALPVRLAHLLAHRPHETRKAP